MSAGARARISRRWACWMVSTGSSRMATPLYRGCAAPASAPSTSSVPSRTSSSAALSAPRASCLAPRNRAASANFPGGYREVPWRRPPPRHLPVPAGKIGQAAALLRERVDFRGADEVVLREAADGVRRVADAAVVVADLEIRVVILAVCDMRHGIDERHRAVEVLEAELAPYLGAGGVDRPAVLQLPQQALGGARRQGRHAALARNAFLRAQIAHNKIGRAH